MNSMLVRLGISILMLLVLGVAGMIAWGGPGDPKSLESIRTSVIKRDRSRAPVPLTFKARDGATLSYRFYPAAPSSGPANRVAVLIHGSVGSSLEMHEVAQALSTSGWICVAPDVRGHGGSGVRGDIAQVGQLEEDVVDLMSRIGSEFPAGPRLLLGHSAGGGFALRLSSHDVMNSFNAIVLLAPFVGVDAPTTRPNGGWAALGLPRLIGLKLLGMIGVHQFDYLPVLSFAVAPEAAPLLTPRYSYRLMQNFAPHTDWSSDIAALQKPTWLLAGGDDELFFSEHYSQVFRSRAEVRVIPKIDHMGITGEPAALQAIVQVAQELVANRQANLAP